MAIQNNYLASERFYEKGKCIECREFISHPLCQRCIAKHVRAWLGDCRILETLDKRVKSSEHFSENKTRCIVCSKKIAVCPYCVTAELLSLLKKQGVSKRIIEEFFAFFNYDFEHQGYSKEAEIMGII